MFSVVIPLYNKELSIKNTIHSVLNQTFQEFEVIIVDDGSTDNSKIEVEKINDPRIKLFSKKNGGVSSARNFGIEKASNKWIAFLDGDDLWYKNHLDEIQSLIKEYSNEKVFTTSFKFSDNREFYKHIRKKDHFLINNYFKEAIKEPLLWTSILVIEKSCIKISGGFNENISRGEDLDFFARLARNFSIAKSNLITAVYQVDTENKLTSTKSKYEKSIVSIIDLKEKKNYERIYFKNIVIKRFKENIKAFNINELIKLIRIHNIELLK